MRPAREIVSKGRDHFFAKRKWNDFESPSNSAASVNTHSERSDVPLSRSFGLAVFRGPEADPEARGLVAGVISNPF